jgi:hypothetical protein
METTIVKHNEQLVTDSVESSKDDVQLNSHTTAAMATATASTAAAPGSVAKNSKFESAYRLPTIQKHLLNRQFDLEARINAEVTALDISAHGAHVLVGFGNGFIIC